MGNVKSNLSTHLNATSGQIQRRNVPWTNPRFQFMLQRITDFSHGCCVFIVSANGEDLSNMYCN